MKKLAKLLALLLALTLAFSLAACGGEPAPAGTPSSEAPPRPLPLRTPPSPPPELPALKVGRFPGRPTPRSSSR